MRACLVLVALTGAALADRAPAEAILPKHRAPPPQQQQPAPVPTPVEVAALAKTRAGTWTCKGNTQNGDGSSTPLQGTLIGKLDLDNAWLQLSFTSDKLKVTIYRGYDSVAKQWTQVELQSTSAHVMSTSPGEQNGAWTWTGTQSSPSGTLQVADHEQLDGKQLKMWGEALLGGSWQKIYEVTCAQ
jgi:hypothetical protein